MININKKCLCPVELLYNYYFMIIHTIINNVVYVVHILNDVFFKF